MHRPVHVLFVCSGNTCRSPMAAGYFRQLCRAAGYEVAIDSAGVSATDGAPISPLAESVLAAEGATPVRMSSQLLTRFLVEWADRVIVMTTRHQRQVLAAHPKADAKVSTLFSLGGDSSDVPDPFGGDAAEYRTCLAIMKPALTALLHALPRPEIRGT